jgi:hypothetical protein
VSAPIPRLDFDHWYLTPAVRATWALFRYHRTRVEGRLHDGPCIYVAHHGAGYLSMDLVLAIYAIGWQEALERGGQHRPLRITAARSRIERVIPGARRIKEIVGLIDPAEAACVAALEAGHQLLLIPGGSRECQPSRDFYRLRWADRLGFARLAVRAGVPIVPLAIAGGAEAFPGFRLGRLSFWLPFPLPARILVAIGEPIPVERSAERARDPAALRPLHARAWQETQALLDRTVARRKAPR